MSKEAMKLALEALQRIDLWLKARYQVGLVGVELEAIKTLEEALAKQEQELALQKLHDENERLGLYKDVYGEEHKESVRLQCVVCNTVYAKGIPPQVAKQEQGVDWKDMYKKEKRRSAMWVAKYEKDIGPLERATPQQEQGEPVAWADHGVVNWIADKQFKHAALLYEHPQQRTWVGLTDEEFEEIWKRYGCYELMREIEAKLRSKNT